MKKFEGVGFPLALCMMIIKDQKWRRASWENGTVVYARRPVYGDPYLCIWRQGVKSLSTPWVPDNADLFAEDWQLFDDVEGA